MKKGRCKNSENHLNDLCVKNEKVGNFSKQIESSEHKQSFEEISLLDNFSEEKEVNGNLEEVIFKNFESEIKEEELLEDEDFLNENNAHAKV